MSEFIFKLCVNCGFYLFTKKHRKNLFEISADLRLHNQRIFVFSDFKKIILFVECFLIFIECS